MISYDLEFWSKTIQSWIYIATYGSYDMTKKRQDFKEAEDIRFKRNPQIYRIAEVTKRVISSNLIEPTQRVISI